jgi:CubicO group peptidase (beta-lactamase class C family)
MRARLFDPLGMGDTAFHATDTARLASCYMPQREGPLALWDPPDGAWSRPPAFEDGAGGLVSTIDDVLAFGAMLLAGGTAADGTRVLSESGAKAMCSDQLTDAQKQEGLAFLDENSWGFGQAVQPDGAFGWAGGFGATFLVDPALDLVCVVLTQRMFTGPDDHKLHSAIQTAARGA